MANKKKTLKETDKGSKEIITVLEAYQEPEEIITRALERLDFLIAITQNMKSRVEVLNAVLQKIAYS